MNVDDMIQQSRNNRNKKLLLLGGLIVILILAVIVVGYYLLHRQPITNALSGRAVAPVYRSSLEGGLDWPLGVAASPDGNTIYVVDSNHKTVKMFDPNGKQTGSFGQTAADKSANTTFSNPLYAAVNSTGKVFVTDRSAAMVVVYDPATKQTTRFNPRVDKSFSWSPLAVCVDQKDNIYITDATKSLHRVLVFDPEGKVILQFGKEGQNQGEFSFPNGITVGSDGSIYVADSNNSRVQVFDKAGKYKFSIGNTGGKTALGHPVGICFDISGNLNVVDTFGHAVQVYDKNGKYLYKYGEYGTKNGQFQFPMGITSLNNSLYVVDREGKRVQVWQH